MAGEPGMPQLGTGHAWYLSAGAGQTGAHPPAGKGLAKGFQGFGQLQPSLLYTECDRQIPQERRHGHLLSVPHSLSGLRNAETWELSGRHPYDKAVPGRALTLGSAERKLACKEGHAPDCQPEPVRG